MSIRVLLVDDQELIRKGFRMVLDASTASRWSERPTTAAPRSNSWSMLRQMSS